VYIGVHAVSCQFPADRAEFSHGLLLYRDGHGLAEEANGRPPAVNWQDMPRLSPNIPKNCAFCDTSTKFGTNVH